MSLIHIKHGISGNYPERVGTQVTLTIAGEEVAAVTIQEGKYLFIEGIEYQLVTQGQTVEVDIDRSNEGKPPIHREYTVPPGRVMVVRWTYEDE